MINLKKISILWTVLSIKFGIWWSINHRVEKANGWNKYKVRKRFLLFFWRDIKNATFNTKQAAYAAAIRMNNPRKTLNS